MPTKDIRLTFFYSDESVYDFVKKHTIKKRLIKWANDFYGRKEYDFKIDEFPVSYNEQLYKNKFSLAKTNGIKVDYRIFDRLKEEVETLEKKAEKNKLKVKDLESKIPNSDPSTEATILIERYDLQKEILKLEKEIRSKTGIMSNSHSFEIDFRILIGNINKSLLLKEERLSIVFCEFIGSGGGRAVPETGRNLKPNDIIYLSWVFPSFKKDVYAGPLIFINVQSIRTDMEVTLAHEIVHAAGNTTEDNEGAAKNIMIYKDIYGKKPSEVNLEPSDKIKLESAFFVIKNK